MVVYLGSKKKLANDIIQLLIRFKADKKEYVEPFVGGNSIVPVMPPNLFDKIVISDIIEDAGLFYAGLFNGTFQPNYEMKMDLDIYTDWRYNKPPSAERFYVGNTFSHMGTFFTTFAHKTGDKQTFSEKGRGQQSIPKLAEGLRQHSNIEFLSGDYLQFSNKRNCVFYLDPPYKGARSRYNRSEAFDYDTFWAFCRQLVEQDNVVLVSELGAPEDFDCIFQKELPMQIYKSNGVPRLEKVFLGMKDKPEGLKLDTIQADINRIFYAD